MMINSDALVLSFEKMLKLSLTGLLLAFLVCVRPALALEAEMFLPGAILEPGKTPGLILVVDKSIQELRIYRHDGKGQVFLEKVIPCSTGMSQGDKLTRGDKKTPDGYYIFRQKLLPGELPDIYGILAYPMDYPNFWDKKDGRGGDGIWTHGINKPLVDYDSNGCIELHNHDLAALEDSISLFETPVLVYEKLDLRPVSELKDEVAKIKNFVESWRVAWTRKDHVVYQSKYSPSFVNSEGKSFSAWMEHKRNIAKNYRTIELRLENLKIFRHRDVIVVSFVQNYRGDQRFSSVGGKRLYLKEAETGYQIVAEEFTGPVPMQPNKWLTASQKNTALTTPPLAVAEVSEPVVVASAGVLLPALNDTVLNQPIGGQDSAGAAADEIARAALEQSAVGRVPLLVADNEDLATPEEKNPKAPIEETKFLDEPEEDSFLADPQVVLMPEETEILAVPVIDDQTLLLELVKSWAGYWQNKDEANYFSLYDRDFYFADKALSFSGFKVYRSRLINKAGSIKVGLENILVSLDGLNEAQVTFIQNYQADSLKDRGQKTLSFKKKGDDWKIIGEVWKALP